MESSESEGPNVHESAETELSSDIVAKDEEIDYSNFIDGISALTEEDPVVDALASSFSAPIFADHPSTNDRTILDAPGENEREEASGVLDENETLRSSGVNASSHFPLNETITSSKDDARCERSSGVFADQKDVSSSQPQPQPCRSEADENTPPNCWGPVTDPSIVDGADSVFPFYDERDAVNNLDDAVIRDRRDDARANRVSPQANQLKRKREEVFSTDDPAALDKRDRERTLQALRVNAWVDVKKEMTGRFFQWSPEGRYLNNPSTVESFAKDFVDDAWIVDDEKRVDSSSKTGLRVSTPVIQRGKRPRLVSWPSAFDRCSDEIVLHIFRWLPKLTLSKVMRVCKRFQCIACDESLWHRLDLGDKIIKPGQLGIALSRGVLSARLMKAEIHSPLFLDHSLLFGVFFKVQHLDLSMVVVDDQELLHKILAHSPKVTHLSFERCVILPSTLRLVSKMLDLKVLNLSTCADGSGQGLGLSGKGVVNIFSCCSSLSHLNLAWVGFAKDDLNLVVDCLPRTLVQLNISGNRNTLDDGNLQRLSNRCSSLEVLDISDSHLLTVLSVPDLCEKLTQLQHLSISRCYGLQPPSILLPLSDCDNLHRLDVFGIMSGQVLKQFARHFRSGFQINKSYFSYVARPTPWDPNKMKSRCPESTKIWGVQTREDPA